MFFNRKSIRWMRSVGQHHIVRDKRIVHYPGRKKVHLLPVASFSFKSQCHYQETYIDTFTKRPSRFGWLIKDKLAGSGRLMTKSQLAWVTKNGIKSVFTIREYPLPQSWFPLGFGIDYKHLKVENYGAPPVD